MLGWLAAISRARDSDADGVPDPADDCPRTADPTQTADLADPIVLPDLTDAVWAGRSPSATIAHQPGGIVVWPRSSSPRQINVPVAGPTAQT